jgi:hypothetical protein
MAESSEPAHYIVFHPESKRYALPVWATALIGDRRVDSWAGKVWVDKPPGNEDPFVLGSSWAYSYCHATQLRRDPRPTGEYVMKGSSILFCSGDLGNEGVLAVDTIFWISEAHQWISAGKPPSRYSRDVADRTDLWGFHLRFGGQFGGHKGKYTNEAALYPQPDDRYSRLPLDANGERVQVALKDLSFDLRGRIIRGLRDQKRPIRLSDADLRSILRFVQDRTAVAVVGKTVPNDSTFTELRMEKDTGCQPCQPKTKEVCC